MAKVQVSLLWLIQGNRGRHDAVVSTSQDDACRELWGLYALSNIRLLEYGSCMSIEN